MDFIELVYVDEEQWLLQKQNRLSSTEINQIMSGTDSAFRKLKEKKALPTGKRWMGNVYTEWGHAREPIIADFVTSIIDDGFAPNKNFLVREDDDRLGATPDMYALTPDGEVTNCQIKTTKNHWESVKNIPRSYYVQCQWEMFILGANRTLFVWEPYDVDEDGDFIPNLIRWGWLERDDELIGKMKDIAEQYFAYEVPEEDHAVGDFETAMLIQELADVEEALKESNARTKGIQQRRDELRVELLDSLGTDERVMNYAGYRLEIGPTRTTTSFDRKSFEVDHPDLIGGYLSRRESAPTVKIKYDSGE